MKPAATACPNSSNPLGCRQLHTAATIAPIVIAVPYTLAGIMNASAITIMFGHHALSHILFPVSSVCRTRTMAMPIAAKTRENVLLEGGIGKVGSVTATATARHAETEGTWKVQVVAFASLMQG
ncbi:hypothetical protein MMC27_000506 [Xylographa pallens]|nr:hypothetical protein [Xylographa pallens]